MTNIMKVKTFKDYLYEFSDDEIINRIFELYTTPESQGSRDGYMDTLKYLRTSTPTKDEDHDFKILLEECENEYGEGTYIHVSLLDSDGTHYGPCGHFSDRLDEEVIAPKELADLDIAAHILWEITFYGYTEEQVSNTIGSWKEEVSETIKEYTEKV